MPLKIYDFVEVLVQKEFVTVKRVFFFLNIAAFQSILRCLPADCSDQFPTGICKLSLNIARLIAMLQYSENRTTDLTVKRVYKKVVSLKFTLAAICRINLTVKNGAQ